MSAPVIKIHPSPETFKQNSKDALADKPLRKSLRTAMDMLMTKRKAVLSDEEELQMLRTLCEHIRQRSLARLPELLEQLEENLTKRGVRVHWAETIICKSATSAPWKAIWANSSCRWQAKNPPTSSCPPSTKPKSR